MRSAAKNALSSLPVLLIASMLLPPVGLVMWWLRPWRGGWARRALAVLGRTAVSVLLAALTMTYLVKTGILHMELSGAGWRPIFSFHKPKQDLESLEKHRAAQRAQPPPETPAAVSAPSAGAARAKAPVRPLETEKAAPLETKALGPSWTDFRGPDRAGVYTGGSILTEWPDEGLKMLWRQPVGGGYASFVIANGKAYTIEQRRARETVAAYDVATGRELWTDGWNALFTESMGGDGPRATPVWEKGKLYTLGATGELRCYDAETGRVVWGKNILTAYGATNLTWGMANSPLPAGDRLIVTPGGRGRSVVALDRHTGDFIWGSLDDQAAYTSPILAGIAGQQQIVVVTAKRVVGLALEDGRLLWEFPWPTMNGINCSQPIVTDANHVFVSAGYDHGAALIEVGHSESGFTARAVWQNRNLKNRFNSSLLHDGFIYGFDEGIFACIDARTGARRWKGGRYGYGQALLAGGHIIVLAESGNLVLLRATPESHQELARFDAIEGKTWNHPAIAGGILLVRNAREMAAFRVAP